MEMNLRAKIRSVDRLQARDNRLAKKYAAFAKSISAGA
jgi:hypothetical protein